MIEGAICLYIFLPSLFNCIVVKYKKNKTLKIIKSKLSEKGYNIDSRMEKDIVRKIIIDCTNWNYFDSDWNNEISFSFMPFIRWILIPSNIKYLCGDYSSFNESYRFLEDIVDNNEDVIKNLKNCGYISIDEEKRQWINDRDNALKELEKKYDDAKTNNKENTIEINDSDNLEILMKKRQILDEMIEERKQTDISSKPKSRIYANNKSAK